MVLYQLSSICRCIFALKINEKKEKKIFLFQLRQLVNMQVFGFRVNRFKQLSLY